MIDWLILLLLCSEVAIFILVEQSLFGSLLTPFTFLAVPYTSVVVLAFFFAPLLGFMPLHMESTWIWITGLFAFFLAGIIVWFPVRKVVKNSLHTLHPFRYEQPSNSIALLMAWLCVGFILYETARALKAAGTFSVLGHDEFTTIYAQGILGHAVVVSELLLVYFIGTLSLDKTKLATFILLFGCVLLYQGKGSILLPTVGGILYRILSGRVRLSIRQIGFIVILGYILFNIVYLIGFFSQSGNVSLSLLKATYQPLFYHFWFFAFSGTLGLSEWIHNGIPLANISSPALVFAPFLNIFYKFFYHTTVEAEAATNIVVHGGYTLIHPALGKSTNVYTMMGTLVSCLGYWGTIVYILYMGFIFYSLFLLVVKTQNCWIAICFTFLCSTLIFGWFSFFLSLLTYTEIPVLCLLLAFVIQLITKPKRTTSSRPLQTPVSTGGYR